MKVYDIRPIDLAEYLRGQRDRAEGYLIIAHGDETVDQDGQATDAYCAGYDPQAEIIPYKDGEQAEGEAFRNQLTQAANETQNIEMFRISIDKKDTVHLNHHVLREHLAAQIASLLELHSSFRSMHITTETGGNVKLWRRYLKERKKAKSKDANVRHHAIVEMKYLRRRMRQTRTK